MTFTILNTRSTHQASQLSHFITQELNALSIEQPLLEIESIASTHWLSTIKNNPIDLLIFTSANAVTYSVEQLRKLLNPMPRVAAIGPATKQCLNEHGINVELMPETSNSESLINVLSSKSVTFKNVAIVKGEAGRNALQNYFNKQELNFFELNVYKRVAPHQLQVNLKKIWKKHPIDLILIYSVDALNNLLSHADPMLLDVIKKTPCLALSDRITFVAQTAGLENVFSAYKHSMEQSIKNYMTHRKLL